MDHENQETADKFVKIDWKGLSKTNIAESAEDQEVQEASQAILRADLESALTNASEYSQDNQAQLCRLLLESVSELKKVLSLDTQIKIQINKAKKPLGKERTIATFKVGENGENIIVFSGSFLEICLSSLDLIDNFSQSLQSLSDDDSEAREIYAEQIQEQSETLSRLIFYLGHEMYHARQAEQAKQKFKIDPYTADLGERSAEAFGIRYLREKKKVISSEENKSLLDAIILLGSESVVNDETKRLEDRSNKKG